MAFTIRAEGEPIDENPLYVALTRKFFEVLA
jgi:hypothetical protein